MQSIENQRTKMIEILAKLEQEDALFVMRIVCSLVNWKHLTSATEVD